MQLLSHHQQTPRLHSTPCKVASYVSLFHSVTRAALALRITCTSCCTRFMVCPRMP